MTETAVHSPGTFAWVDLAVDDPAKAKTFYTELFGWGVQELGPEAGGYAMFTKGTDQVAGVGPKQDAAQPTAWSLYVGTDDAKATAQKVRDAGGTVVAEPFDVLGQGVLGVFQDPTGAFFSIWQPEQMGGFLTDGSHGTFAWPELSTRDVDAARDFYTSVFGWGHKVMADYGYNEFTHDGHDIAGFMGMEQQPAEVPPHWTAYFNVDNCEAAVNRAKMLGGNVFMGPEAISGVGTIAVLADPEGAVFGLLQPQR